MSEKSSGRRWSLTVWFGDAGNYRVFGFDGEPRVTQGTRVVTYHGEREGRAVRVNVVIDQVPAWSLEEIPR